MPGLIQASAMSINVTPSLTGVTAGNTLIAFFGSGTTTWAAPTDSAGQTWTLRTSVNAGGTSFAIAYLLNANAGTHNLTGTASGGANSMMIEVNGITAVGGTPVTNTGGSTTAATGSYTPSQANEFIVAGMIEGGTNASDHIQCTLATFQTLGTVTDFGGFNCLGVQENGSSTTAGECNGSITSTGAAVNPAWSFTPSSSWACAVAGFQYNPGGGIVVAWLT